MTATVTEISSHPRYIRPLDDRSPATKAVDAAFSPAPKSKERPTREDAIRRIKVGLEKRSSKRWSVTGGRGTAWGWLRIDAPPRERTWRSKEDGLGGWVEYDSGKPNSGNMSPARRSELGTLLGLEGPAHMQGVSIPSGGTYWDEYIERAETGTSAIKSTPYWD